MGSNQLRLNIADINILQILRDLMTVIMDIAQRQTQLVILPYFVIIIIIPQVHLNNIERVT